MQSSTHSLTVREMAILTSLSKGLTAESLARRLSISPTRLENIRSTFTASWMCATA